MECNSLLLTDLYELTMLQAYDHAGTGGTATFEFFFRDLPPERNFLVAAGLESAVAFIEQARFTADELEWLANQEALSRDFVERLANWRFTGDVYAVPEGSVVFPHEPVLQITAPLSQGQLLESRLINLVHLQTLIASKAVRCVLAAPDSVLVDFGLRRAHGAEAGLLAARAAYLAGFAGTATVLAGQRYDIPLFGTMAHSFIQVYLNESTAFENFAKAHRGSLVFLIDTYDTEAGARRVVELAPRLREKGLQVGGVRLDSGDLAEHARRVRAILDAGGLSRTSIFASGNLDEYSLAELRAAGAPITGFGVGSRLDTSSDVPYLDCAYKLSEYEGQPRRKRSEGKATWPGRKQVWRRYDAAGTMAGDTVALADEPGEGTPLLVPWLQAGRRVREPEPLAAVRQRCAEQVAQLPEPLRRLSHAPPYPVAFSVGLKQAAAAADAAADRVMSPPR